MNTMAKTIIAGPQHMIKATFRLIYLGPIFLKIFKNGTSPCQKYVVVLRNVVGEVYYHFGNHHAAFVKNSSPSLLFLQLIQEFNDSLVLIDLLYNVWFIFRIAS
ncbi:hypothetical protein BBR47_35970 [Brevibacillus brevis NBRC 100599]|uniref:Uncharacterized protein n=1 Tax=Brevibacillus brevis (strain 47 / JCM 6285 / NBRC 100599) TaxID=358681 RepID=C0ZFL5_BREBN|nr:hypothetical protein BBR47_35970 [Brevibacillus brevis NBRC 100599]